ncbi:MAG: exonuclease SbcCD subunit D [Actinomycetota bacterium]|nr:exonuclease SbcCD subunit D [Actinomycetota bacterium]
MIRVLHFSDLHLGSDYHGKPDPETGINQRILDFAARLDELIAFAEANDVDVVLFAGDAFKNATPTPTVQKLLAERVWRLAKSGVRVFMLAGNHDLPRMVANVTAFSVYPALEVENVTVAEQAGVYPIETRKGELLQIAAMPHFWRSAFTRQIDTGATPGDIDRAIDKMVAAKVDDLAARLNPSVPAILSAHCHVTKARLSTAQDLYGISDFELSLSSIAHRAFPYVALGHIHKSQVLNDEWRGGTFAAYSGSLDRVDFGEEGEEKGFFVADFEHGSLTAEPQFIPVAARSFVTVKAKVDSQDPTGSVVAAIEKATVSGAVVRVQVEAPRHLYEEVDQQRVRLALEPAYDARVQAIYPDESSPTVRDPRFAEAMSEARALEEFVRGDPALVMDADELLRLGNEIISEVLAQT